MRKTVKRQIYKDVFRFIWLPLVISVVSSGMENLLLIRSADLLGSFADTVFALDLSAGLQALGTFAAVLALTILAVPALHFVGDVILVKSAMSHDRMVLSRFLDKRCDAVGKVDAGDMLNRLDDDPNELRLELLSVCTSVLIIPVAVTYLMVSVRKISLLYFFIVFCISLVKLIVPVFVKKAQKKYHRETKEYASSVRAAETDFSSRAHLVNLFGIGRMLIERQDKRYHAFFRTTGKKSLRLNAAVDSLQSFVNTICLTAVLLVGAYFAALGRISPGHVAAMIGYYSILNRIIRECNGLIRKLPILGNTTERLTYFYEDAEPGVGGKRIERIRELRGEKLTFCYADKPVFAPCTFTIRAGEKVVVRGRNGSGKSTFLNVFLGILQGYGGSLTIDGTELSSVDPDSYRELVAYAPQDPYLFKGTILDNIKLASPHPDETEVRQLLRAYGIPHIAEREIESGGYELSGGERQKISMIRAMIKDTPVIFLDEPENNLDVTAVQAVKEWLCHSEKTVIYVSHNPELIACADREITLV